MISDGQVINTVAICVVSDGRFVTHGQIPRPPYFDGGRNPGVASHLCTEQPQQHAAPAETDPRRTSKQSHPHRGPDHSGHFVTERMRTGTVLFTYLNGHEMKSFAYQSVTAGRPCADLRLSLPGPSVSLSGRLFGNAGHVAYEASAETPLHSSSCVHRCRTSGLLYRCATSRRDNRGFRCPERNAFKRSVS